MEMIVLKLLRKVFTRREVPSALDQVLFGKDGRKWKKRRGEVNKSQTRSKAICAQKKVSDKYRSRY